MNKCIVVNVGSGVRLLFRSIPAMWTARQAQETRLSDASRVQSCVVAICSVFRDS